MKSKKVLITGSCGLVGSESVMFYLDLGFEVWGVDNNSRATYFGKEASVGPIIQKLSNYKHYNHINCCITDGLIEETVSKIKPDLIIHCAAQPSHDKSCFMPYEDFRINALSTLNLLEVVRKNCPECVFVFVSTNKVYGDNPNKIRMQELEDRFEFVHVSPMPSAYQGKNKLSKLNYFCCSIARNTGVCYAKYPYIAFIDDLSVMGNGSLHEIVNCANKNIVAAFAYKKVFNLEVEDGKT
jgi:nucleoside-diphosphate-sugar epimerase